jgi:transcriptional regulator with XRE-family HTH domain
VAKTKAEKFGSFLRSLRIKRDLTMLQVAQQVTKAGRPIAESYVSMIETGRRNPPPENLLDAFAKALDVDEEILRYAARGKLYRPIIDFLHERRVRPALIRKLQIAKDSDKSSLKIIECLGEIFDALHGAELIFLVRPDGAIDLSVVEDLK